MLNRRHALGLALAALAAPHAAWSGGKDKISVPIRLQNNRVLMDVALNGREGYEFILDTGAEIGGVKQRVAEELGLLSGGEIMVNGRSVPLFDIGELRLGGAVQERGVAFFGIEDRGLGGHGLLPAGLLTIHDSELDFERGLWSIYPNGRPTYEGFSRVDTIVDRPREGLSPRLAGAIELEGHDLRPVWDTGAPHALAVDHETARRLGLLAEERATRSVAYARLGGREEDEAHTVIARRLTIGPVDYADVPVLVRPESLGRSMPLLGLPILQTLNIAYDTRRGALWIQRNGLAVGNYQA